ncbi:MAG: dehypoxanthine futalosine cyclase [Candidatus Tectomicrobia bacterium]|uniref:Cyclic dehypoxanthine futalosine synthase n=1 Tax=Tectimicrobiota bacterium TaxID=2528274 RepID=A0A933GPU2_UNCTE|nr:dehypoxanthine futalosine cyclase [Candidatus Tectomicrobia bacterium]
MMPKIESKVANRERLEAEELLFLFEKVDLLSLGQLAQLIREQKHSERIVTYVVDRNINYTNICLSGCRFCAFYQKPNSSKGYVLSREELSLKIRETLALGGTQILMQGGLHPSLDIDYFQELLVFIKDNFKIHIHAFSPPEIVHLARLSNLSIKDTIVKLRNAGLDSIPGGGAEILCDDIRTAISPNKYSTEQWLEVMQVGHEVGLKTTATMMFGHIETFSHRVEHFLRIRELQDKTGGFTAFIPWSFQPSNTQLGGKEVFAHDYLRTLAISRLAIDNVDNIQVSWVTQGGKVAQVGLQFGANDFGSTMIEENVVAAAGVSFRLSREEIVRLITDAGYLARQRDMQYNLIG